MYIKAIEPLEPSSPLMYNLTSTLPASLLEGAMHDASVSDNINAPTESSPKLQNAFEDTFDQLLNPLPVIVTVTPPLKAPASGVTLDTDGAAKYVNVNSVSETHNTSFTTTETSTDPAACAGDKHAISVSDSYLAALSLSPKEQ